MLRAGLLCARLGSPVAQSMCRGADRSARLAPTSEVGATLVGKAAGGSRAVGVSGAAGSRSGMVATSAMRTRSLSTQGSGWWCRWAGEIDGGDEVVRYDDGGDDVNHDLTLGWSRWNGLTMGVGSDSRWGAGSDMEVADEAEGAELVLPEHGSPRVPEYGREGEAAAEQLGLGRRGLVRALLVVISLAYTSVRWGAVASEWLGSRPRLVRPPSERKSEHTLLTSSALEAFLRGLEFGGSHMVLRATLGRDLTLLELEALDKGLERPEQVIFRRVPCWTGVLDVAVRAVRHMRQTVIDRANDPPPADEPAYRCPVRSERTGAHIQ
ncbi:hypothetical protein CYMTET_9786 [Cymbomonas tetramitiformis]|uniref:Uncharacterized protein n=1 Tax=Cymbomonas tetramitiformis TaxID=36881 RepID=A0AAE0GQS2_9CHLO|nr:hypothetical protein CYMTET_9786 [Cymbomonas tetramitiformis]